jgi:Integrase core domain/Integrase zinc binding domain
MLTTGNSDLPSSEEDDSFVPGLDIETVAEDGLLPKPVYPRASPLIQVPEPLEAIYVEDLLSAQAEDPWCDSLWAQLQHGINPTKPPGLCIYEHGALACAPMDEDLPLRWVSPASLRSRICTLAHFTRVSGHPGSKKLTASLSRHLFWPSLARDSNCAQLFVTCSQEVEARTQTDGTIDDIPSDPATRVRGNRRVRALAYNVARQQFVLCMTDRFSKMLVAVPLPDKTVSIVAQTLMDRWIALFGIPVTLLSENGSAFDCMFFGALTQVLGVKQVFTSAYRPTTNGRVERWNATLVDCIAALAFEKDWDLSIGTTRLSIRRQVTHQ